MVVIKRFFLNVFFNSINRFSFSFSFYCLNQMNCGYCVCHSRTCFENCSMRKLFPACSLDYRKIVNHYGEFYVKELLERIPEQHKVACVTSLVFDANGRALYEVNRALGYIRWLSKDRDRTTLGLRGPWPPSLWKKNFLVYILA